MRGSLFCILLFFTSCTQTPMLDKDYSFKDRTELQQKYAVATFAGGCFWCMEGPFEAEPGVAEAIAGFTGGDFKNPTYEQVSSGQTDHREGVEIFYDPEIVSFSRLLDIYWRQIDPTDEGGQFADRGFHYTTAIYYHDDAQKAAAEKSKKELAESEMFEKPIATEILPAKEFYPADEYHQDFYQHSAERYNIYKKGSGRSDYIEKTWGDVKQYTDEELKAKLTPMQYKVTQQDGTEPPFDNEYWDNTEEGIYVDIVSGEPLFSSIDKYKSGTGWPSFVKPLVPENIVEKDDWSWFSKRTEIRSRYADSHLGHVFTDGPQDRGGLRYCMNSAALRFVPKEKMAEEGYEEFMNIFE